MYVVVHQRTKASSDEEQPNHCGKGNERIEHEGKRLALASPRERPHNSMLAACGSSFRVARVSGSSKTGGVAEI